MWFVFTTDIVGAKHAPMALILKFAMIIHIFGPNYKINKSDLSQAHG